MNTNLRIPIMFGRCRCVFSTVQKPSLPLSVESFPEVGLDSVSPTRAVKSSSPDVFAATLASILFPIPEPSRALVQMSLPQDSTVTVFWWAGLQAEYAQSPIKDVSGVIKTVLEFLFI